MNDGAEHSAVSCLWQVPRKWQQSPTGSLSLQAALVFGSTPCLEGEQVLRRAVVLEPRLADGRLEPLFSGPIQTLPVPSHSTHTRCFSPIFN